jgi:transcriptional regulator with XRE-family HTH domain
MTVADPSADELPELARRLRQLRVRHGDKTVTQRMVAQALGGSGKPLAQSLISGWEKGTFAPPSDRLREIATFYASKRSVAGQHARLLQDDELTPEEKAARDELFDELSALRADVGGRPDVAGNDSIRFDWAFPGAASVRIVCGKLDDPAHPYTSISNRNYSEILTYADTDALVELHGHIRKVNPDADVRYRRSDLLAGVDSSDELVSHLVLLGGIGLNALTDRMLAASGMPIRQKAHPAVPEGEIFEVDDGEKKVEFFPKESGDVLMEDVGLIARMPNPLNSSTTLTLCNGVYARGVLGAVRTLTDDLLRRQNEAWLTERFSGAARFAILMRVPVVLDKAATPDLTTEATRLYEWCDQR